MDGKQCSEQTQPEGHFTLLLDYLALDKTQPQGKAKDKSQSPDKLKHQPPPPPPQQFNIPNDQLPIALKQLIPQLDISNLSNDNAINDFINKPDIATTDVLRRCINYINAHYCAKKDQQFDPEGTDATARSFKQWCKDLRKKHRLHVVALFFIVVLYGNGITKRVLTGRIAELLSDEVENYKQQNYWRLLRADTLVFACCLQQTNSVQKFFARFNLQKNTLFGSLDANSYAKITMLQALYNRVIDQPNIDYHNRATLNTLREEINEAAKKLKILPPDQNRLDEKDQIQRNDDNDDSDDAGIMDNISSTFTNSTAVVDNEPSINVIFDNGSLRHGSMCSEPVRWYLDKSIQYQPNLTYVEDNVFFYDGEPLISYDEPVRNLLLPKRDTLTLQIDSEKCRCCRAGRGSIFTVIRRLVGLTFGLFKCHPHIADQILSWKAHYLTLDLPGSRDIQRAVDCIIMPQTAYASLFSELILTLLRPVIVFPDSCHISWQLGAKLLAVKPVAMESSHGCNRILLHHSFYFLQSPGCVGEWTFPGSRHYIKWQIYRFGGSLVSLGALSREEAAHLRRSNAKAVVLRDEDEIDYELTPDEISRSKVLCAGDMSVIARWADQIHPPSLDLLIFPFDSIEVRDDITSTTELQYTIHSLRHIRLPVISLPPIPPPELPKEYTRGDRHRLSDKRIYFRMPDVYRNKKWIPCMKELKRYLSYGPGDAIDKEELERSDKPIIIDNSQILDWSKFSGYRSLFQKEGAHLIRQFPVAHYRWKQIERLYPGVIAVKLVDADCPIESKFVVHQFHLLQLIESRTTLQQPIILGTVVAARPALPVPQSVVSTTARVYHKAPKHRSSVQTGDNRLATPTISAISTQSPNIDDPSSYTFITMPNDTGMVDDSELQIDSLNK